MLMNVVRVFYHLITYVVVARRPTKLITMCRCQAKRNSISPVALHNAQLSKLTNKQPALTQLGKRAAVCDRQSRRTQMKTKRSF